MASKTQGGERFRTFRVLLKNFPLSLAHMENHILTIVLGVPELKDSTGVGQTSTIPTPWTNRYASEEFAAMAADIAYSIFELKFEHNWGYSPCQTIKSIIGEIEYDPYGKFTSILSAFGVEVIWNKLGKLVHTPMLTEEEWIEWIGKIANDAK